MRAILISIILSLAWVSVVAAQPPYTVGTVLDIGSYAEKEPLSGFGFERVNSTRAQKCGIGFGGTVKVIYVNPLTPTTYYVQYTPTTSNGTSGVLYECKGTSAYFTMTEDELTNQNGFHDAVVANPPQ